MYAYILVVCVLRMRTHRLENVQVIIKVAVVLSHVLIASLLRTYQRRLSLVTVAT